MWAKLFDALSGQVIWTFSIAIVQRFHNEFHPFASDAGGYIKALTNVLGVNPFSGVGEGISLCMRNIFLDALDFLIKCIVKTICNIFRLVQSDAIFDDDSWFASVLEVVEIFDFFPHIFRLLVVVEIALPILPFELCVELGALIPEFVESL